MSTRTVRLDQETETALREIRARTGLSISEALKRGLLVLQREVHGAAERTAFDVYEQLDLGPGGYAIAPSTETRAAAREAIERKLGR